MLAIIGGQPERFVPYIDLYKQAVGQFDTTAWPVGMHPPGFIADTDEQAKEFIWPHYKVVRDRIGARRGWPPVRREEFEADIQHGSMYIGSAETVAKRIARTVSSLGVGRFDLIFSSGAQPISARLKSVELYGSKVVPMVREILDDHDREGSVVA
jgi:alkanesulfonate monooxygenase SsuD/methylene tetrahydromethanopterin reductase-like flavin-dependent oxidoreductase (luciferase family)